jgi:predicted TIM-barrel fold metal-dependent hydrolase
MMAHCVSLVSEGVFQEFPTLRFGFIEGGICWAPYVMWRLDRMYPSLKAEVPYLSKKPSEYILSNCYFSTQPIEEPDEREHLVQMFEMLHAEKTVIFASDYPHWDFDNPLTVLSFLPPAMKRHLCRQRGRLLRTARVLQSHTTRERIDVDLHHQVADWSAVAPYVPRAALAGGPKVRPGAHGFRSVGAPARGEGHDPAQVKEHYLDARGIDTAIWRQSARAWRAAQSVGGGDARAINDWTLETWVRPFRCYRGSI